MNRTVVLVCIALVAGALTGEWLSKRPSTHRIIGRVFQRGQLVAMIGHSGVFDDEPMAEGVLGVTARNARLNGSEVERAMFALGGQFGDARHFGAALRSSGIWKWQMRRMMADLLRGEEWIENALREQTVVSEKEARHYFEQHPADFTQPMRIRARHIFLAAPEGSVNAEEKRAAMEEIVARLDRGEDFVALAAAISEDEATKSRGGDLGFVAADRVPPEFWGALEAQPMNATPAFAQSHLGFHAVQVLDIRSARAMTFEEAQPEITQLMAGRKRREVVPTIRDQLTRKAMLVTR